MPEELSVKRKPAANQGNGWRGRRQGEEKGGLVGREQEGPESQGGQETACPSAFEVRIPGDGTRHLFSFPFLSSGL